MANFYDDAKFGVINRKWFGLTKKHGGDVATGYSNTATNGATVVTHLARWYPRGPIKMLKVGHYTMATLTNDATDPDQWIGKVLTRGASASVVATWNLVDASAPYAFGSKSTITVAQCKAGEYISIKTGTMQTDKGTAIGGTETGTVAFFVDYLPDYDSTGKWDT
jgi:hypothetical protein